MILLIIVLEIMHFDDGFQLSRNKLPPLLLLGILKGNYEGNCSILGVWITLGILQQRGPLSSSSVLIGVGNPGLLHFEFHIYVHYKVYQLFEVAKVVFMSGKIWTSGHWGNVRSSIIGRKVGMAVKAMKDNLVPSVAQNTFTGHSYPS